ncbi:MAG: hypothetical protein Q9222_004834 [Ikaeria aurantiellina]
MVGIGVSPAGFDAWWQVQAFQSPHGSTGPAKVVYKAPVHVGESLVKGHLNPGSRLDSLQIEVLRRIKDHFSTCAGPADNAGTSSLAHVDGNTSLLRWCSEILIDSATRGFFGDELMQIDKGVASSFVEFDDLNWQFILPYPSILSRKMTSARNKVISALTTYFKRPLDTRVNASAFVLSLESEMRSQGLSDEDIAAMQMLTVWAINSNTYKLCFWVMAHIIHDNDLLESIRHETKEVADLKPSEIVGALEKCPRLDAVYYEVLRLSTASTSIRTVMSPSMVGGKYLSPGNDVFIPSRQMHFDPGVFGSDAHCFNAARFLDNAMRKSASYRPFGGGTTYCPGRFLARSEVLTFVALALNRFSISVIDKDEDNRHFPRLETRMPSLGVLAPIVGDDVMLQISPRNPF